MHDGYYDYADWALLEKNAKWKSMNKASSHIKMDNRIEGRIDLYAAYCIPHSG